MAFRVAAQNREATIQYLRAREQVTMVYLERVRPVTLSDGRRVDAVTYVTDPRHEQYAGKLSLAEMIALARQGHGRSGSAVEYIRNTAEHLDRLGINDRLLRTVVTKLENDME